MHKYKQVSLEQKTFELAERYAKEEGYSSVSSFIRNLIRSYPFIKMIKEMGERGLIPNDVAKMDYYSDGGSLLISFKESSDVTKKSDALVLVGFTKKGELASIEILFDDRDVIRRLDEVFNRNREVAICKCSD